MFACDLMPAAPAPAAGCDTSAVFEALSALEEAFLYVCTSKARKWSTCDTSEGFEEVSALEEAAAVALALAFVAAEGTVALACAAVKTAAAAASVFVRLYSKSK